MSSEQIQTGSEATAVGFEVTCVGSEATLPGKVAFTGDVKATAVPGKPAIHFCLGINLYFVFL